MICGLAMHLQRIPLGSTQVEITGDPVDSYFRDAATHAAHLEPLARLVQREVAPGSLILDVGANIGLSTILLARAVPDVRVIAFEPSPRNAKFLRQNLTINAIDNVSVVEAAASDRVGVVHFHEAAFGAGSHVVGSEHLGGESWNTVSVPAVPLDQHFAGSNAPVVFAKIDCEGHEPEVLAGAASLFARDRPLIAIEFNSWTLNAFGGHSPAEIAASLWANYEVLHVLAADGSLSPAPADPLSFLHNNLTRDGCVSDLVLRPRLGITLPARLEHKQLAALRTEISAMRASTSWRVTRPLRWLGRKLGKR